ncbi:MAG: hypothetical protein IKQ82_10450, partial [Lentisphaeria bacterium]|nr:hypothetical protein [Lentisphaeria bacterium]
WRLPLRFLYPANWCASGFEEALEYLKRHDELRNEATLLTNSSGKLVWCIPLPDEFGGGSVAWKFCEGKTPWRYIINLSHPAREWRNYRAISGLGIPCGEVLAFGEERKYGWKLENSFIVTRFIEGTRNGCDFMPGGPRRDDVAMRKRFCTLIAPEIAKMHRHGFYHKALHARNILWRGDTPETMEIFFIDVARCRIRFGFALPWVIRFDLYTPLRDLELPTDESLEFLRLYHENYPDCPLTLPELENSLRKYRRHHKKFNVIDGHPNS